MPLSRTFATYLFEGKSTVDDVVFLLSKYKLLALLPQVKKMLVQISHSAHKKDAMISETPFVLGEEALIHIKTIAGNSKVLHEVIINKHILAGFKAKYKGLLYDGSAERIIRQITTK